MITDKQLESYTSLGNNYLRIPNAKTYKRITDTVLNIAKNMRKDNGKNVDHFYILLKKQMELMESIMKDELNIELKTRTIREVAKKYDLDDLSLNQLKDVAQALKLSKAGTKNELKLKISAELERL